MCVRLGCVGVRCRIKLPSWKSFPQHCELLHWELLQGPDDLQMLGETSGDNAAHHAWCAQKTDPVPYPAWRPPDRHEMNVWAINCLWNFLTLAAAYCLSLAPHHHLIAPFSYSAWLPRPLFPVPILWWLLSHAHSVCLFFQPHTGSLPLAQPLSTSWSLPFGSLCLRDKSNDDVSFPLMHAQTLVPDIHFTLNQALPGNEYTSEYYRVFYLPAPKILCTVNIIQLWRC